MRDCRFVEFYAEVGKLWDGAIDKLAKDGKTVVRRGDQYIVPNVNKYSDDANELKELGFRESSLMDWDFD